MRVKTDRTKIIISKKDIIKPRIDRVYRNIEQNKQDQEINRYESISAKMWLRNKGRTVNALALGADEGRDEHRYALGSCK